MHNENCCDAAKTLRKVLALLTRMVLVVFLKHCAARLTVLARQWFHALRLQITILSGVNKRFSTLIITQRPAAPRLYQSQVKESFRLATFKCAGFLNKHAG
jgi:hypothetical protein